MMVDRHTKEILRHSVFFDIRPAGKAILYTVILSGERPSVGEEMQFGSPGLLLVGKRVDACALAGRDDSWPYAIALCLCLTPSP